MNNKGFMMAELIVVSAIILTFMTGLYISYNKLFSMYKKRMSYYDSTTLYDLAYYRDNLVGAGLMNDAVTAASTQPFDIFIVTSRLNSGDSVYLINNTMISDNNIPGISSGFRDYINYLLTSIRYSTGDYMMLMERCDGRLENCTYAYLNVPIIGGN